MFMSRGRFMFRTGTGTETETEIRTRRLGVAPGDVGCHSERLTLIPQTH